MVRIKHRYLLLNILYPEGPLSASSQLDHLRFHGPTPQYVTPQLFLAHVRSYISHVFGEHGLGVSIASLKLVYFSHATSTIILRVPRAFYRYTWAALSYMTELPLPHGAASRAANCVVRVVRVSGTIKKAEEELVRRSRREVVRATMLADSRHADVLDRLKGSANNAPTIPPGNLRNAIETSEAEADSDSPA